MDIRNKFKTYGPKSKTSLYSLLLFYIGECRKHTPERLYWFNTNINDPRLEEFGQLIPLCKKFDIDPKHYLMAQVDQAIYEKKDFVPPHCLSKDWGIDMFSKACRRIHDEEAETISFSESEIDESHIRNLNDVKIVLDNIGSKTFDSYCSSGDWRKLFADDTDYIDLIHPRIDVVFKDISQSYQNWFYRKNQSEYSLSGCHYSQSVIDAFVAIFGNDTVGGQPDLLSISCQ